MPRSENTQREEEGFRGDLAGLSLPDVIQLNGGSGFSGCITVRHEDRIGRVFMRDGRIVHAEQGERSGEEALCDVLEWRSGRFSLEPNVATTCATIQKTAQHALIDALRILDERRAGRAPPPPPAARPQPAAAATGPSALERVREAPGVRGAVIVRRDGTPVAPEGAGAEGLATQAACLAATGDRLGAVLRAGPLRGAAVRGADHHLLLLAGRSSHLGLRVGAAEDLAAVEAGVRKLLEAPR